MSRTKKFVYNSFSLALLQLVTIAIGFIIPRVMIKTYGSEVNGLIISISGFIGYFSLAEAGLSGAAVYELYKPLISNDHKTINAIVSAVKKFYTVSGYIFMALTVLLVLLYPLCVRSSVVGVFGVSVLVFIIGIAGALELFTMAKYRVLLTADQKIYVLSFSSIISLALSASIIILSAYLKVNIIILKVAALAPILLRSLILYLYVKWKYKYINYNAEADMQALDKRWDVFYLQILGVVQVGAPIVILTVFTNLKLVSIYSIFTIIISGVSGVLGIFLNGLSSSVGNVIARKELKILQKTTEETESIFYGLLTIFFSITMVTLMPFVRLYTRGISDANYDLPTIGILFVINGIFSNLKAPQGMLVISAGMYKETRKQSTIQALILVVAGVILVPSFGLAGVLVASCLSNLYRVVDLLYFVPHNLTKLPIRKTFIKQFMVLICLIIIWISSRFVNICPNNYYEWFKYVFIVMFYSLLIAIAMTMLFDRTNLKYVYFRIRRFARLKR
ncbi:MAG: hypothetical protein A2452_13555 [Candidatus Firestonebacteria bacterium RIFOXYC2_FULL_39_67]|nr:MAG: hypothetical protein A2452_13555 [Candidatus Firestonebacteria bacterium RIFOXYC2_FULL_39_67]OGF57312.1 MAG: hypothetical protein A2497_03785 [Candidatus Firestonebacteria bacterium RifOxyC12_full_39_7]